MWRKWEKHFGLSEEFFLPRDTQKLCSGAKPLTTAQTQMHLRVQNQIKIHLHQGKIEMCRQTSTEE
jgi:hypothetical protein